MTRIKSTLTPIQERYEVVAKKLEEIRRQSRLARVNLIATVNCGGKDVLSEGEMEKIKFAIANFLKVQRQFGKAFYTWSKVWAKVLAESAKADEDFSGD